MSPPWWPDPGDLMLPQVQAEMEPHSAGRGRWGWLDVIPEADSARPQVSVPAEHELVPPPAEPCREAGRTEECALCPRTPGLQSL